MNHDYESAAWADNHRAVSDAISGAIDKLGYVVVSIVAHRRAAARRAQRVADFGC